MLAKRQSTRLRSPADVPRSIRVIAIALGCVLAVGVAALGVLFGGSSGTDSARRTGPLALSPVPAPAAGSAECSNVLSALPPTLLSAGDQLQRRELVAPAPPATVAWGNAEHDPVILRCGLQRPGELTPTSHLTEVSGVNWLQIPGPGASTWVAVNRAPFVALTLPEDAGTGPLQDVSTTVAHTLPRHDPFR